MRHFLIYLTALLLLAGCSARKTAGVRHDDTYFSGWMFYKNDELHFADAASGITFPVDRSAHYRKTAELFAATKPEDCDAVFAELRGRIISDTQTEENQIGRLAVDYLIGFDHHREYSHYEFIIPGVYISSSDIGMHVLVLIPDYTYESTYLQVADTVAFTRGRWYMESPDDLILKDHTENRQDFKFSNRRDFNHCCGGRFVNLFEVIPDQHEIVKKEGDLHLVYEKVYLR